MKKVLLRAPVLTQSGYGVHSRQIFSWLSQKQEIDLSVQLLPWGETPWLLNKGSSEIVRKIMSCSKSALDVDVTFQVQLPNEWDPKLGRFNVGITAAVETTTCNPKWIDACNAMNVVIVPSTHTANVLKASGHITTPVFVVPESYPSVFDDVTDQLDIDLESKFNFLIFGQMTGNTFTSDRKGVLSALRCLCEEFKDEKDVGIVVKTNMGRNSLIDRRVTLSILKQITEDARGKSPYPRVKVIHGAMSDVEIAELYKNPSIKAAVSLTRGEGYGLPILEAARAGVPIIATAWSGHMDFMKHGKFINVAHKLVDVHSSKIDNRIFMQGTKWAEPSEDDFKKKARKFFEAPTAPKQWASELANVIKEKYNAQEIFNAYDNVDIVKGALT